MNKDELKTMIEAIAGVISTVAVLCYWIKAERNLAKIKKEKKLLEEKLEALSNVNDDI